MRQPSIKCIGEITDLGGKIAGGLEELGAGLKLRVTDHEEFGAELATLEGQQSEYHLSQLELAKRSEAVKQAVKEVRGFMRLTRDTLKPVLGYRYSQAWNALGLIGTLMIPMSPVKVSVMLKVACEYLKGHPEVEVAKLEITSARALQLDARLDAAVEALATHELAMGKTLAARNVQAEKVRGLIRLLIAELTFILGPLDPRWTRFGFNLPGAKERPEAPEGIEFQMVDETKGAMKWPPVPRAERYRVWMRPVGSTEPPVLVATVLDPDFMLESVPAESEVWVTALNRGGESLRSEVIMMGVLPGV